MPFMRLLRSDDPGVARAEPGTPIPFKAVTPGKKRDGLDTAVLPWRTDRYQRNPVVTWVHDFMGNRLPIGRGEVRTADTDAGEEMDVAITFDVADAFAAEVDRKYRSGFLHAVSVSWDDVDEDGVPVRSSGKKAVSHDLLEIAAVPVPGDPDALMERQVTALRAVRTDIDRLLGDEEKPTGKRMIVGSYEEKRGRIESALATSGLLSGEIYILSTLDDFVVACVWNTETWVSRYYKVPYTQAADGGIAFGELVPVRIVHDVVDQEGNAVRALVNGDDSWMDAAAAMVDVFARGSDDPDDKRRRAYNALLPAYRHLGRTPPEWVTGAELRALDDANWQALFLSGELEVTGERVGAELSSRNVQELTEVRDAVQDAGKRLGTLLDRVSSKNQPAEEEDDAEERTALADILRGLQQLATGEEAA